MADNGFLAGLLSALNDGQTFNPDKRLEQQSKLASLTRNNAEVAKIQAESGIQPVMPAEHQEGFAHFMHGVFGGTPQAQQFTAGAVDTNLSKAVMAKLKESGATPEIVAQADAYLNQKPIRNIHDAQTFESTFGGKTRADYFNPQGVNPDTGLQIAFNHSNGKYYEGGKEVPPEKVKRLLSRIAPNMDGKSVRDLADLDTEKQQFSYVASMYKPEYVGPIKGTIQQTIDQYLNSDQPERAQFYTAVNNALINRLKRVSGGAVTPQEAERFSKAFFNANKSPQSFEASLNYFINTNDVEAMNYARLLGGAGFAKASSVARKGTADMKKDNVSEAQAAQPSPISPNKPSKAPKSLPGMTIH